MKLIIRKSRFVHLIPLLYFLGCHSPIQETAEDERIPNIQEILEKQKSILSSASLEKTIKVGNKTENKIFNATQWDWSKELAFFEEIEPNQPKYTGAYDISASNQGFTFILKKDEKHALKHIKGYWKNNIIQKLYAEIKENKDIYTIEKIIQINFSNGLLDHYSISGFQNVMFQDTIYFAITGKLILNSSSGNK